jgi:HK97 family phage prohead protease
MKKYKVKINGHTEELAIGEKVAASVQVSVKAVDKENNKLTMVASTQDVDRHGDTVVQEGWDLKPFKKNPVILNSHNYNDATEVIARAENVRIEGKGKRAKLVMDWVFAVDENPKAKVIFDLYAGKFLHASSVGFMVLEFAEDKDGNKDWWTIEKAELLEVSAVSVPANAMALAKSKGVDVSALETQKTEEPDPVDDDPEETEDPEEPEDVEPEEEPEEVPKDPEKTPGIPEKTEEPEIPEDPEEEPEPEVQPQAPEKSYIEKVSTAIRNIDSKEKRQLRKVADIIKGLIDESDQKIAKETQAKIRKRKVNQAIRMLLKTK